MHVAPLVDGKPGERLVEQQQFRILRQCHRDFHAPALAIGGLRQRPVGDMIEADLGQRRARVINEVTLAFQHDQRIPARGGEAEQRERDVVQDGVTRKQRDDLIRPRHAEVCALAARHMRDIAAEQEDRAAVGRQFAGNQVEQGGLAGTVRSDDQAPFPGFDGKIDVAGDVQAAERFAQSVDGERGHDFGPAVSATATSFARWRSTRHPMRHSRAVPGTRPSGMKMTIATKIAPSIKFHRSI